MVIQGVCCQCSMARKECKTFKKCQFKSKAKLIIHSTNDYVLFYGQSPHQWRQTSSYFSRQEHYFDDYTYYFITVDLGQGQRISTIDQQVSADTLINTFDDYHIFENNRSQLYKVGS